MKILLLLTLIIVPVISQAIDRGADGRILRSRTEVARFKRMHPCPATGSAYGACRGYVIDHKIPLACGGPDAVRNMQWQTVVDGRAKDKWERKRCGRAG